MKSEIERVFECVSIIQKRKGIEGFQAAFYKD